MVDEMSETQQRSNYADAGRHPGPEDRQTRWTGFVAFAGMMLMMVGGFQVIEGIVALLNDDYYLVTRNGLLIGLDYTTWGWTHLVVGAIAVGAGIGILMGQLWARVLGIVVAALSALVNIAFLSAYPVWSAIIIALDVLAIYALAVHGREIDY